MNVCGCSGVKSRKSTKDLRLSDTLKLSLHQQFEVFQRVIGAERLNRSSPLRTHMCVCVCVRSARAREHDMCLVGTLDHQPISHTCRHQRQFELTPPVGGAAPCQHSQFPISAAPAAPDSHGLIHIQMQRWTRTTGPIAVLQRR